jgi:ABC-type transporter Mla subunit MlaD
VRYRGADIGRVMAINVAPDQKLIQVTLKLKLKKEITKEGVAQLRVNPISGQVSMELDRLKPDEEPRLFKTDFTAPYPVIPSRYFDVQKAMAGGVNILVEKLEESDAKGIFDQVKSTVKQVEVFFRGPRMESILEKVEGTMANVQSITGRVDKLLAAGRVEEVLKEAQNTLIGAQTVMAQIDKEIKDVNVKEILGRSRSLTTEIKATSENLRTTTETLDNLVNRISERPPDLLFGKPSPGRFNE